MISLVWEGDIFEDAPGLVSSAIDLLYWVSHLLKAIKDGAPRRLPSWTHGPPQSWGRSDYNTPSHPGGAIESKSLQAAHAL